MFKNLKLFLIISASILLYSKGASAVNIAYIDNDVIYKNSVAAQDIAAQLNKLKDNFKSKIEAEKNNLQKMQEDLLNQRSVLNEGEFAKSKQELDQKYLKIQEDLKDHKQNIEKTALQYSDLLLNEVSKISAQIATENNFDIILSKNQIIYADSKYNITGKVIEALNNSVKKIELNK